MPFKQITQEQTGVFSILCAFLLDSEEEKYYITQKCDKILHDFTTLQEINLDLEIDYCQAIEDVDQFESYILKYQQLLKAAEGENMQCKDYVKRLINQKEHYENVVEYFKEEMKNMSEQLCNLQEILTASNESAEEETSVMLKTLNDMKETNRNLTCKLYATEQKMQLENQMNQLNEAKIKDLEKLITCKNTSNVQYSDTIQTIKKSLEEVLQQNNELKSCIFSLSQSFVQLQNTSQTDCCKKNKELAKSCQCRIESCEAKLNDVKEILESKHVEFNELKYTCKKQCIDSNEEIYKLKKCIQDLESQCKYYEENTIQNNQCLIENLRKQLADAKKQLNESLVKEKEKEKQNQEILKELKDKCDCVKEKEKTINRMQILITELNNELDKSIGNENEICNLRKTIKELEDTRESYTEKDKTIKRMQVLIDDLNCTVKNNSEKEKEILKLKNDIKDLKSKLKKSNEKDENINNLQTAYDGLNKKLTDRMEEIVKLKDTIVDLKCKVENCESKNNKSAEMSKTKEQELDRYRKIIGDLKKTLDDLNKGCVNKEMKKCDKEECRAETSCDEDSDLDIPCLCEIDFYKTIVESLKESVVGLKKQLTEFQIKCNALEKNTKEKDSKIDDLKKYCSKKDKELVDLRNRLTEKLQKCQAEEEKYKTVASQLENELLQLKQDLCDKAGKLNELKRNAKDINSSRCIQLACAQDEITLLKNELNRLLKKHCALNSENEKLKCENSALQSTVSSLQERTDVLKNQLDHYVQELTTLQHDREELQRKNNELLAELKTLQTSYSQLNRQQRYTLDSVRNLEAELDVLKTNREEICNESKNVVTYVRAWLQEQRKIDEYVAGKEKNFIDRLKDCEDAAVKPQVRSKKSFSYIPQSQSQRPTCQSPWSLGSQGTASGYEDDRDHSRSNPGIECAWYSSNFPNDSDDYEEEEEDWATKVENLAAQVRRTNNMWKNKIINQCENDEYLKKYDSPKNLKK